MRAAIAFEAGADMVVASDVELDAAHAGEVRVQVDSCGLCHSDLSTLDGVLPGQFPKILGPESAGSLLTWDLASAPLLTASG